MFNNNAVLKTTNKLHHRFACRIPIQIDISHHFFYSGDTSVKNAQQVAKTISPTESYEYFASNIIRANVYTSDITFKKYTDNYQVLKIGGKNYLNILS